MRGEFVESNLGSSEDPGGGVTVPMIAEQYLFVPQCVVVPIGVPIGDAGDEVKAVPGYIVETRVQFERRIRRMIALFLSLCPTLSTKW